MEKRNKNGMGTTLTTRGLVEELSKQPQQCQMTQNGSTVMHSHHIFFSFLIGARRGSRPDLGRNSEMWSGASTVNPSEK